MHRNYYSDQSYKYRETHTMNNNKSRAAISLQESWASNISDYILLRRQQTHVAYSMTDAKPNASSAKVDRTPDSGLFTALFTMLATHLEEGHTVHRVGD